MSEASILLNIKAWLGSICGNFFGLGGLGGLGSIQRNSCPVAQGKWIL